MDASGEAQACKVLKSQRMSDASSDGSQNYVETKPC